MADRWTDEELSAELAEAERTLAANAADDVADGRDPATSVSGIVVDFRQYAEILRELADLRQGRGRLDPAQAMEWEALSEDGGAYPTDEALDRITRAHYRDIVRCLRETWHPFYGSVSDELRPAEAEVVGDPMHVGGKLWRFATGGWSGCEAAIAAFHESPWSGMLQRMTTIGGLYIIEEPGPDEPITEADR